MLIYSDFIFIFYFYIPSHVLFYFSNLRRLVHAMILKQPPREWIGTFRFVILQLVFSALHLKGPKELIYRYAPLHPFHFHLLYSCFSNLQAFPSIGLGGFRYWKFA